MDEQSVYLSALEMKTPSERSAFLQKACGADVALRERLEAMLRRAEDGDDFFDKSPADFVNCQPRSADEVDHEAFLRTLLTASDKPGCLGTLQEYEVQEVVGAGATGVVLKAYEPALNRFVAIKVLGHGQAFDALAEKRFLREAKSAAAVIHPNVVTIHAVAEGPPPYLVMEYVSGRSLEKKIRSVGHLEVHEILRIGSQLAQGLAAAHKQGLIHRDIKPENILLENGVERVKITDFGLARAVHDDLNLSYAGAVSGTPPYMSPEQAKGERVDHRSDLFSLGSVLYAMCTGKAPFLAENWLAVMRRVVEDSPRPIIEQNPDIPRWLRDIIAKLQDKDPGQRYQSAAEVSELLDSHLLQLQHPASDDFILQRTPPDSPTVHAHLLPESPLVNEKKSHQFPYLFQLGVMVAVVAVVMMLSILVYGLPWHQPDQDSSMIVSPQPTDSSTAAGSTPVTDQTGTPLPVNTVSRIIDDSDRDYSEINKEGTSKTLGWKSSTDPVLRERAYAQSYRFSSEGAMTARWTFRDLPTGEYELWITWPAGPQFHGIANYGIYDGETMFRRHEFNQGRNPTDYPQVESYQGVDWVRLDTVLIESGTAILELDSRISKKGGVACDAVWLRSKHSTAE